MSTKTPSLNQVKEMAKDLGLKFNNIKKADLIRNVQQAEGNFPCFQCDGAKENCHEENCLWRAECISEK